MTAQWTSRGIMAGFLGGAVMVCAAVSEAVPVTWNLLFRERCHEHQHRCHSRR